MKERFREAWHLGYAARLAGKHSKLDNPYENAKILLRLGVSTNQLHDFYAWRKGYFAACNERLDEIDRMISEDHEFRSQIEFLGMRAYWQGLHSNAQDTNPYTQAKNPYQPWIDAWKRGQNEQQHMGV